MALVTSSGSYRILQQHQQTCLPTLKQKRADSPRSLNPLSVLSVVSSLAGRSTMWATWVSWRMWWSVSSCSFLPVSKSKTPDFVACIFTEDSSKPWTHLFPLQTRLAHSFCYPVKSVAVDRLTLFLCQVRQQVESLHETDRPASRVSTTQPTTPQPGVWGATPVVSYCLG